MDNVLENIGILNNEPVDESAYQKIESNKKLSGLDLLGNGKVSMCVMAVDSNYLDKLISQGYGEKRIGTYGTMLDKIQMDEIVLGDDGLKKVVLNKENIDERRVISL